MADTNQHHHKQSLINDQSNRVCLRIRMESHDAHYAGALVDGAKMLQLFGDAATELLIRYDGDEGLFRAYESVEFMAPVYAGDYIEVTAQLMSAGNSSRKIAFEAKKYIRPLQVKDAGYLGVSSAELLEPPIIVCKAIGTCVTPKGLQRIKR